MLVPGCPLRPIAALPKYFLRRIDNETCSKPQDDGANLQSLFLPNGLQQRHERVMFLHAADEDGSVPRTAGLAAVVCSEDHPCSQLLSTRIRCGEGY